MSYGHAEGINHLSARPDFPVNAARYSLAVVEIGLRG